MWAVIVFPPVVVPWEIDRPRICPWCGEGGSIYVHERVTRKLSYIKPQIDHDPERLPLLFYNTIRFRCTICRRTFTETPPNRSKRFLLQRNLEAKIVTWYCRGDTVSNIMEKIENHDFRVSRSTIYNVIKSSKDEILLSLHRVNRSRRTRGYRRMSNSYTYASNFILGHRSRYYLSEEIFDIYDDLGPDAKVIIARWDVELFSVYKNENSIKTLTWIEEFLSGLGQSGVMLYDSRAELERDFDPNAPLPREIRYSSEDLLISLGRLNHRFDKTSRIVWEAVRTAVRMADFHDHARESVPDDSVVLKQGHDPSLINSFAEEDLFDPV